MTVALAIALAGFGVSLAFNIALIIYALNLAANLDNALADLRTREYDHTAQVVDEAIDRLQENHDG